MRLPRGAASDPPFDTVVAALATRRSLLVLDNLEHLLGDDGATIRLIRDLLDRVPTLSILATSRQRLGIDGEREVPLPPLRTPTDTIEALTEIDSVRLFVDRARAVRPDFAITPQNAEAVATLCERLEGLPLAIELGAAWAQTLTPAQMLSKLTRRFDLLVSRRKDIPQRHRTLRAAIEYSYLLLPAELQHVFTALSVFRGGWTLEAAEAVCGDAADDAFPDLLTALTELRERSLIVADENAGEMRYRMLETLREFAVEQQTLAIAAPLRRRHALFFLELAETAEERLAGPEQPIWLARLNREHDNLRAALAWTAEENEANATEIGLRLVGALPQFWDVHGYLSEGQEWLERLLSRPDSARNHGVAPARARNALAYVARARGAFALARAEAEAALERFRTLGDARGMAASLQMLATLAYSREDYDTARACAEAGLEIARRIGAPALIGGALLNLGNIAMELRDWPRADALFSEGLALYRAAGIRARIADSLNNLGLVARYRGDLETARRLLEEDLAISRELGNRSTIAIALLNLGTVHRLSGRLDAARDALDEATRLALDVDNKRGLAWCVKEIGHLACAEGAFARGVRLLAASERLRQTLGISFQPADPEALQTEIARARVALGDPIFDAAWRAGETTPLSFADVGRDALEKNPMPRA